MKVEWYNSLFAYRLIFLQVQRYTGKVQMQVFIFQILYPTQSKKKVIKEPFASFQGAKDVHGDMFRFKNKRFTQWAIIGFFPQSYCSPIWLPTQFAGHLSASFPNASQKSYSTRIVFELSVRRHLLSGVEV